jgi:hypothetical protein
VFLLNKEFFFYIIDVMSIEDNNKHRKSNSYSVDLSLHYRNWVLVATWDVDIHTDFLSRDLRLEKVLTKSGNKFRTWDVGKHTGSAALARRFAGRPVAQNHTNHVHQPFL